MRLTFQTCIMVFALSFTPVFGEATAPVTPREKVAKIIELTSSQQAYTTSIENTVPQYINAVRLKNANIAPNQIRQIVTIYKQALIDTRSLVREGLADAWIETYSEEEIDAIYKFYTSPLGASIAAKQPALLQSTQSKTRMVAQTIFAPELIKRLKSDPILKDLAF